jgi:xanthine dehydrogenase YagR molybdenum-binding subunit
LVLSRKQFYSVVGFRATSRQRLAIGADRSGRISAIIHEGRTENSRYEGYEDNIVGPPRFMYSSPNMRSVYRSVPLDINPPTYMRGPGTTTGAFALECAMDDLAVRLGIDPIELRLRNEPDRDQFEDVPFSTRRLTECFRQGAAAFGWSRRNPTPRATRDGNQLIGIGTAATVYHTLRSECTVSARINADGTAHVQTASSDMGPGTYTSMTQVAADALGPIRARRQQLSAGARARWFADDCQRRLGDCACGRHAARPLHSHRGGRSRITSFRSSARGCRRRRRSAVSHRRTGARRKLPGSAAASRLGKP